MSKLSGETTPSFFDDDYPDVDQRSCRLLGPTALTVQALMGILVILSLVYKRHREKPKRPWKIWMFDVSKQLAGQLFIHGLNVLISDLVAHHASGNPCVLYFLNILIDTTLGVAIIYLILRVLTQLFTNKLHLKGFQSGQYGDPPSLTYWARQAAVYVMALMTMKLIVLALFALWPGIQKIGAWLLSWTGGGDAVQVIFVMGLIPISMNVLQFWLIDSIVKASAYQVQGQVTDGSSRQTADQEPLFNDLNSGDEDGDEGEISSRGYDIENPSSLQQPISPPKSNEEPKSDSRRISVVGAEDHEEAHAYPPHTSSPSSSSVLSRSSTRSPPLRRFPRNRSPPPPLELRPQPGPVDSIRAHVIATNGTP